MVWHDRVVRADSVGAWLWEDRSRVATLGRIPVEPVEKFL